MYGMLFAIDSGPCSKLSVLSRLDNISRNVKFTENDEAERYGKRANISSFLRLSYIVSIAH